MSGARAELLSKFSSHNIRQHVHTYRYNWSHYCTRHRTDVGPQQVHFAYYAHMTSAQFSTGNLAKFVSQFAKFHGSPQPSDH